MENLNQVLNNVTPELVVIAISIFFLFFGIVFGLIRGRNRSILRIILVILCGVGAGFLCGKVSDAVANYDLGSVGLGEQNQTVTTMLNDNLQGFGDLAMPIIAVIIRILVFVVSFLLLRFLSLIIVYPILKIIVRSEGNKKKGTRKKRFQGAFIGLIQGALICFFIFSPLTYLAGAIAQVDADDINALLNSTNSTAQTTSNVVTFSSPKDLNKIILFAEVDYDDEDEIIEEPTTGEQGSIVNAEVIASVLNVIKDYGNSAIGKIYGVAKPLNTMTFRVTNSKGETVDIYITIEAISMTAKIAREVLSIKDTIDSINLENNGDTSAYLNAFADALEKIGEIKDGSSEEAVKVLQSMMETLVDSLVGDGEGSEEGVAKTMSAIKDVSLEDIDFQNEADLIRDLSKLKEDVESEGVEGITDEEKEELIKEMAQSTFFIAIVDTAIDDDTNLGYSESDTASIKESIDKVFADETNTELNQENKEKLYKFFGISIETEDDLPDVPQVII